MANLARSLSTQIKRAMTGVGRTSLVSEIDSNRSIIVFASIFNQCVSLKDITKRLNEKLLTFDRFKSKVTEDTKYFQIIPDFDCAQCIEEEIISSSTLSKYESLKEFLEETISSFTNRPFTMEHSKPLWRMHLFQFQSINKTAMILRCHHCICDGITFGEIWLRLSDDFDESENGNIFQTSSNSSISTQSSLEYSYKKCNNICHTLLFVFLWIIGMFYVFIKMFILALSKESQTIFKHKLSEQKYVSYISEGLSFNQINMKRKALRIGKKRPTFNDFMLTVIAESVMLYLDEKKEYIPDTVHLAIPVNIRDKSVKILNDTMLGNKIGSYIIKMPLSKKLSFMQKLARIKNELDFAKKTPEAKLSYYGFVLLSKLPQCIVDTVGPKMTGGMTLVASNVKGAADDTYICGAKVVEVIGIVPPPMGVGLGYVIFSFAGKVIVTVNVDKNAFDEQTAKELMRCFKKVLKQQKCIETAED